MYHDPQAISPADDPRPGPNARRLSLSLPELRSPEFVRDMALIADIAVIAALLVAAHLAVPSPGAAEVPGLVGYAWLALFAQRTWQHRTEDARTLRFDGMSRRVKDWAIASGVLIVGWGVTSEVDWRALQWAGAVLAAGAVALAVCGLAAKRAIGRLALNGAIGDRIAIYGSNSRTIDLIQEIEEQYGAGAAVEAIYDERTTRETLTGAPGEVERDFSRLLQGVRENRIDTVILNLPWSAVERISYFKRQLEAVNVNVCLAPPLAQSGDGLPLRGEGQARLNLYRKPMAGLEALIKLAMDRVMAALALIVLSPLLLAVAAAIKMDSRGPVLFRQKRLGFNNESFHILKFRSMHVADADADASRLVTRKDARVSRVGAFIRRTSIDELPQLVNILLGHMSFVGPRPHAFGAKAADRLYEQVVGRYPARHRVKPGITGLAQVRGHRGNTLQEIDIERRVASDLEYIERWSLSLDFMILVRTATTVLFQKNAY